MCVREVWLCGSRCGLVGGSMSLGMGFEVLKAFFLLPVDPDVELSATSPASCLPACHYDDNGLNLETMSQPH